ncbi:hypothetical protein [Cellulomonas sp. URHD0024]|uniref:hypothetical protein n=1 Tax=Cellulomonas sp. URHD0024 TaxID=1302620 RepID=UPI00040DFBF2|nr:hypothetical protein [Cellulomonas sp. URHD0024]
MSTLSVPPVVATYLAASQAHDVQALDNLRADRYEMYWPQSGERFDRRGVAAMQANYPAGGPTIEDRGIFGSGDNWTGQALLTYPDGKQSWVITLIEIETDAIVHETRFYADPFEAPAWRSAFTTATHGAVPSS